MRTPVSSLALVEPRSLREALRMLHDDPTIVPMAGCTDLYVAMQFGMLPGCRFMNLWPLDGLRGLSSRNGVLAMGALTTYTDVMRSPIVQRRLPMLVEAARQIGAVQIQNRGTIGGNIGNGSPAGDTLPVFAAAEATLVLASIDRERRVPFTHFYTGYRTSVRRPDELIVAVEVPPIEGRQWFRKVGTRAAQAISKVVVAGIRQDGAPRLAYGSVAPTVIRVPRTEAALAAGATVADAQRILQEEISPIDDLRSTCAYRRRVSANLLARFWSETASSL